MSNLRNYSLLLNPNQRIIEFWFTKWKESTWFERFIYLWISFNAIYEWSTIADWDRKAWAEFAEKVEVKKIWEDIRSDFRFSDFHQYLSIREVKNKSWMSVQNGWLYNMKGDTLYVDWDFWNDLKKYIWVIYQIRNNLFHGWKIWVDNDTELINKASDSFLVFLDKLYWFSE